MHRQLNCVLIDDELLALSYLRTMCEEIPEINVLKAFDSPQKMLTEIGGLDIDFYISDIVMPSMSGLELAEKIGNIPVIFTTAHNEFAADAFDIEAIDYLRKPVKKERLEKAVEKLRIVLSQQKTKPVNFNTAKGKMLIASEEIAFISAETLDRRDKLLVTRSGEELVLKNYSFEQLIALLPPELFIRSSRKELLAKSIVKGHSSGTIFSNLKDKSGADRSFVLGDNYKKEFLEQF